MDRLTQGDHLTTEEMEIVSYHLDIARDTQFADITDESQMEMNFKQEPNLW